MFILLVNLFGDILIVHTDIILSVWWVILISESHGRFVKMRSFRLLHKSFILWYMMNQISTLLFFLLLILVLWLFLDFIIPNLLDVHFFLFDFFWFWLIYINFIICWKFYLSVYWITSVLIKLHYRSKIFVLFLTIIIIIRILLWQRNRLLNLLLSIFFRTIGKEFW